jgi:hypothetical protein
MQKSSRRADPASVAAQNPCREPLLDCPSDSVLDEPSATTCFHDGAGWNSAQAQADCALQAPPRDEPCQEQHRTRCDGRHPCFRGVTEAGCVHVALSTLTERRAARHPAFHWVNIILGNITCAITGTNRALRKKHVVRYLAEFEWRFNHRVDLEAMIPALGRAAVNTQPVPYCRLKVTANRA